MAEASGDTFRDDKSISSDVKLLRRIPPGETRASPSGLIPRSNNFSNDANGGGTSVDIWEDGREPEDLLVGHENFGLVWVTVGDLREAELGIVRDQLRDNPHHALIQGRKTKSRLRRLARASNWIREPSHQ